LQSGLLVYGTDYKSAPAGFFTLSPVKRGLKMLYMKSLYINKYPLFAKQRGGKEGGEFVKSGVISSYPSPR